MARRRVLVVFNPDRGPPQGRPLRAALDALGREGAAVTPRETARRGDAQAFARDGSARGDYSTYAPIR